MSILVDRKTRVLVQGITGAAGSFHARQMLAYGTAVVAGVTPGRGGGLFEERGAGLRHRGRRGASRPGPTPACIFVPPAGAADAILEAADAGIALVVAITEGIPVLDMVRVRRALESRPGTRLIGPNCPGVITPEQCKIGIMPGHIHRPGRVGVVSRSGTLTYEAVKQLTDLGLGQSTAVGIGGDPVHGHGLRRRAAALPGGPGHRRRRPDRRDRRRGGGAGGGLHPRALTKPVVGFIAGRTAPPGKRMGHAGAVISGGSGTAAAKIAAMREAGIRWWTAHTCWARR